MAASYQVPSFAARSFSQSLHDSLHTVHSILIDLMLPNAYYLPACAAQFRVVAGVTPAVRFDFCVPFLGELQAPSRELPPVPEVSVHEHGNTRSTEHKIRATGQIPGVAFERAAMARDELREALLGAGVGPADPGHESAALLGAHDVAPVEPLSRP